MKWLTASLPFIYAVAFPIVSLFTNRLPSEGDTILSPYFDKAPSGTDITLTPVGELREHKALRLPADPNLVAAYGFNENTGTSVSDISGNGNNGTFSNGGWITGGRFGAAGTFNGTSSYVTIPDAAGLDLTNGMTLEAWIYPTNVTGYRTVICKENGTSTLAYALSANDNNATLSKQRPNTRIRNSASTSNTTLPGKSKLAINTWTHIASTYDGGTLRFFVNGVQSSSVRVSGNMVVTANVLRIGANIAMGGEYFSGRIDEVRIYKVPLTASQILADMNTPVEADETAPTVTITEPAGGTTVTGTFNVIASAQDNTGGVGVAGVQFKMDGNNLGTEDVIAPYTVSLNSTAVPNGLHTFTAIARDSAGNVATSAAVQVNVNNPDVTAPIISITTPAGSATVSGTINIMANASDNVGVADVQFKLNGNNLGALQTGIAPYSIPWNTLTSLNGTHTITAIARDSVGNIGTASAVQVIVNNIDTTKPQITITAPSNESTLAGTVEVTVNASDNVGVTGVQFLLNGSNLGTEQTVAPYFASWNTEIYPNGNYNLTARARDAAGNIAFSQAVQVTTSNTDNTHPTVSVTQPADGSTLSGMVTLSASASDNTGITSVQFVLDNTIELGNPDSTSPYQYNWDTRTISNGAHSIKAIARDLYNNITTSASLNYSVNNDLTAPVVSITSPASGASVSATVTVTAAASDNNSVAGVQFLLNGILFGSEDNTSPFSVSWNTVSYSNGTYTLAAIARDASGNKDTSDAVQVQVNNISNLLTALPLNEGSGTTTADLSGRNHPGTLTSSLWTTGKYGQGVSFTGTGSYISIPDHSDYTLSPAKNYTWSVWVKNNDFRAWSTILSHSVIGATTNFFYFYAHTIGSVDYGGGPVTNGISVYWFNNGSNYVALHSNSNVLVAGQWSHVAITYDASKVQNNRFSIYVNGADQTYRTAIGSVGTITAIDPTSLQIGNNAAYPGEYLNGSVDEVRFYDRLLTPAEIQADMATPIQNDEVAPAVSIVTPVNGTNVSGDVTVTATASDNIGVAGVQFLLDGVNIGVEDTQAPYSIIWNSQLATNGAHTLSARARDGKGNTTTTSVSVNIVADFKLTLLDTAKYVEQTGQTDFRINVSYLNGYTTGGINLTVNGLPSGATSNFPVNPLTQQGTTQLFITTSNSPIGNNTITVTATSFDGKVKSQQGKLYVTAAADFSLAASPSTQTAAKGSTVKYTINLNETSNYTSPVSLTVTGLPAGVTASFNPSSVTPVGSSELTLSVSSLATAGTYNLTVTGSSNGIIRTVPITLTVSSTPASNLIVEENSKPGNPSSEWDVSGAGDASLQGFATDMSVNKGQTINFKVNITGTNKNYSIRIYRIGYYQGNGARLITTLGPYTGVTQPSPVTNTSMGLVDCGNWSVSASWAVPSTAVSGVYIARLVRADNGGASHILFVVRDDQGTADLLFKTSDATWQAYNVYGGNSLYNGSTGYAGGHATKVSYNRPFITRAGGGGGGASEDWFFNAEYPMIRWLERNGYNLHYSTDVDFERMTTSITPSKYKVLLSVGHDEYWSAAERNRFEAARGAGVHLAFFSGNEVYWKTRWENSIDGSNTPYRTLVCYKEGSMGENVCYSECDPSSQWTGLWRSGCGASATDACKPENALTGQISWELYTGSIQVPAAYKDLRFWRNTTIPSLSSSQTATLPYGTLGYETDFEQTTYNSSYPSGRITLSSTSYNGKVHKLSLYRHTSGALVFGAGTVQWSWGLDDKHDRGSTAPSAIMQQATVNLFADMGVQPSTLQSGLVPATASSDLDAPVTTITSPLIVGEVQSGNPVTITGTCLDNNEVAGVEISVDEGLSWQKVKGTRNWSYVWIPGKKPTSTIRVRGYDDSGNREPDRESNTLFLDTLSTDPSQTIVTGIADREKLKQKTNRDTASVRVHIFPNPSHDAFWLQLSGPGYPEFFDLEITDIMGRSVYRERMFSGKAPILFGSNFASGMYLVNIRLGDKRIVTKILKH